MPRKWLRTKGCQRVNAKGRFPEGKATGTQRDLLNPALRALATKLTPVASSARNGSATAPVGDGTAIASVDVAELVAMPLDRFAREGHCLEVRVPWLDVTLWFVPEERDAAAIGRTGTSRGRVWTASELMALMALPDRTPAIVETVARAKLAVDGDIVEVRPAGPWRRDEDPRAA